MGITRDSLGAGRALIHAGNKVTEAVTRARAAGATTPGEAIRAAREVSAAAHHMVAHAVVLERANGASWEEVTTALGYVPDDLGFVIDHYGPIVDRWFDGAGVGPVLTHT